MTDAPPPEPPEPPAVHAAAPASAAGAGAAPVWADDAALRQGIRARCPRAWREALQRYGPALRHHARLLVAPPLDADDMVSQAWCQALRHAHTYDPGKPLYSWLVTICVRACLRQRAREQGLLARLRHLWQREHGLREARAFEGSSLVHAALDALPAVDREVLVLRYIFGLSTAEVAEAIDTRPAAVRQRVARALRRIRQGALGGTLGSLLEHPPGDDHGTA